MTIKTKSNAWLIFRLGLFLFLVFWRVSHLRMIMEITDDHGADAAQG